MLKYYINVQSKALKYYRVLATTTSVEFIMLLMECIASRFQGAIVSHEITTDSRGENIRISLVFCLLKRQNVVLQSWFKAAMQVFGLSQRMWKHPQTAGTHRPP